MPTADRLLEIAQALGDVKDIQSEMLALLPEEARSARWVAERKGSPNVWEDLVAAFPSYEVDMCRYLHMARQGLEYAYELEHARCYPPQQPDLKLAKKRD